MLDKLIISIINNQISSFAYNNGKLIFVQNDILDDFSEAIYLAKLSKLNHAEQTGFIEYDINKTGFINLARQSPVQEGRLLPVQLMWHGDSDKYPRFRSQWQLIGKYVVYTNDQSFSISPTGVIAEVEVKQYLAKYPGAWTLRSSASSTPPQLIGAELEHLYNIAQLIHAATSAGKYFAGVPNYIKLLRSLPLATDCAVVTNDAQIYQSLLIYQQLWAIDQVNLVENIDLSSSLVEYHRLTSQNKINLENGASFRNS